MPNLTGIVSALPGVLPGVPWTREEVSALRREVEAAGLRLSVIESIPVHEDIKLGNVRRSERIGAFIASLEAVAAAGVPVVCYNFMPVFDWTRTRLDAPLPDGSTSLSFSQADVDPAPGDEPPALPGWAEAYTPEALRALRAAYADVSADQLREHLAYFLRAVVPEAARLGVCLAIHPDDPLWPVLGLPRVVSTADDLDFVLSAVPDKHNGLTFCIGSLGARADNDLPAGGNLDYRERWPPQCRYCRGRKCAAPPPAPAAPVAARRGWSAPGPSR